MYMSSLSSHQIIWNTDCLNLIKFVHIERQIGLLKKTMKHSKMESFSKTNNKTKIEWYEPSGSKTLIHLLKFCNQGRQGEVTTALLRLFYFAICKLYIVCLLLEEQIQ